MKHFSGIAQLLSLSLFLAACGAAPAVPSVPESIPALTEAETTAAFTEPERRHTVHQRVDNQHDAEQDDYCLEQSFDNKFSHVCITVFLQNRVGITARGSRKTLTGLILPV